jgi:hypothetical protein
VFLNKYPNYKIYRALRLCGGMGSVESEALNADLVHELSARVVTVPKQRAMEGTVRVEAERQQF